MNRRRDENEHAYKFPFFNDTRRQELELFKAKIDFVALQLLGHCAGSRLVFFWHGIEVDFTFRHGGL